MSIDIYISVRFHLPSVVSFADALIKPLAVVVEPSHALVARGAVLGALAADGDLTQMATAILDHMRVARAIKLGHHRPLVALLAQVWVCRVDQHGRDVAHEVDDINEGVGGVESRVQRIWQGWDCQQEGQQCKEDEQHPGRQLLRVQRRLQPVHATPLWRPATHLLMK